jgi:hypothetical protein
MQCPFRADNKTLAPAGSAVVPSEGDLEVEARGVGGLGRPVLGDDVAGRERLPAGQRPQPHGEGTHERAPHQAPRGPPHVLHVQPLHRVRLHHGKKMQAEYSNSKLLWYSKLLTHSSNSKQAASEKLYKATKATGMVGIPSSLWIPMNAHMATPETARESQACHRAQDVCQILTAVESTNRCKLQKRASKRERPVQKHGLFSLVLLKQVDQDE